MIIRNAEFLDANGIPSEKMVKSCIKEHGNKLAQWDKNDRYYRGQHEILSRTMREELPNNRLVCNHARVITTTVVSHLLGKPVKYTPEEEEKMAFEAIQELFDRTDIAAIDAELGQDCSVFGKAVEMLYMSSDEEPVPKAVQIDPREGFVVYDDTVEHRRLFGVHCIKAKNEEGEDDGYKISVHCPTVIKNYKSEEKDGDWESLPDTENHFGVVSMHEYFNNEEEQGDFEGQISLIDAYNLLQSDRINDKQQFVDAILVVRGQSFGDTFVETSKTMKALKELKLLELDPEGHAEWLVKSLNEADTEILKKAVSDDIHRFSMVPNVADENFAGNASGVAMAYKLLLLEELTKMKERYFRKGLKERLKLVSNIQSIKSTGFDVGRVEIVFTHSLPINQAEIAGIVAQLANIVPDELLYGLLWFIPDQVAALEMMKSQKEEAIESQKAVLSSPLPEEKKGIDDEQANKPILGRKKP